MVNSQICQALLDTGSSLNIVDRDFLAKLPSSPKIQTATELLISTLGGRVQSSGLVTLTFQLGSSKFTDSFVVISASDFLLPSEILLGLPFLQKFSVTYRGSDNAILIGNQEISPSLSIPCRSENFSLSHEYQASEGLDGIEFWQPLSSQMLTQDQYCLVTLAGEEQSYLLDANSPVKFKVGKKQGSFSVETISKKAVSPELFDKKRESELLGLFQTDHLQPNEAKQLTKLIKENLDCFARNLSEIGSVKDAECEINLTSNMPVNARPYRIPETLKPELKRQIDELLEAGIIEPSKSPYSSPVVMVKKKDGSLRLCCDYRRLNQITIRDVFPLPNINEIFDKLRGAKIFTTCDSYSGYHQIPVPTKDRPKTAFISENGLFQYRRAPFGLVNLPSQFMREMKKIFQDLPFVEVFLDDIICFSKTFVEHLEHLAILFQRLRDVNLKLKMKKCTFGHTSLKFLGHIIQADGIHIDTSKVAAIKDMGAPTTVRELQQVLGLFNYYRRHIPCYSDIVRPLSKLLGPISTKKSGESEKIPWNTEQQEALDTLKNLLTTDKVLIYPDFSKHFFLVTDASNVAVGGVLSQEDEKTGLLKPIAFYSRTLNKAEQRYSTIEKELLAVVYCCTQAKPYIYGRQFTVVTDHAPLTWLLKFRDSTSRLTRFTIKLLEYDFYVIHLPGKDNRVADALSRILPTKTSTKNFQSELLACATFCQINNADILNYQQSTNFQTYVAKLKEKTNMPIKLLSDKLTAIQQNGKWLILLGPEPHALKNTILRNLHDHITSGHFGYKKTHEQVRQFYWWEGLSAFVKNYVSTCDLCQRRKNKPRGMRSLGRYPLPREPFDIISCDLKGPLATSEAGNKYIFCAIDWYTKWIECIPIPDKTAPVVANALICGVISRHGIPNTILTDCGTEMRNTLMTEMCKILNVNKFEISPFHPSSNGQVERVNRTIGDLLAIFINERQNDWDTLLPLLLFAYRNTEHSATGLTPFFSLYHRKVRGPFDLDIPQLRPYADDDDYAAQLSKVMQSTKEQIDRNLLLSKEIQEQNRPVKDTTVFHIGDLVLWYNPIAKRGLSPKLKLANQGPYKIVSKNNDNVFHIQSLDGKWNKRVHADQLKKYKQREEPLLEDDHLIPSLDLNVTSSQSSTAIPISPTPPDPGTSTQVTADPRPEITKRHSTRQSKTPNRYNPATYIDSITEQLHQFALGPF